MGKTYRYDPYAENDRERKDRRIEVRPAPVEPQLEGWDWTRSMIDIDWAVSKMQNRVSVVIEGLIQEGLICEGEREEYTSKYNEQFVKFAGKYDPTRTGKDGRTASPLHYLRIVESGLTSNIRDYAKYRRRNARMCPLVDTYDEAQELSGAICSNDARFSDECSCVEELVLRMDMHTLFEMLDPNERLCLLMRIEGYTQDEIAEKIAECTGEPCDRDHVRKVVQPHIRAKARACGFRPPSEVRKMG